MATRQRASLQRMRTFYANNPGPWCYLYFDYDYWTPLSSDATSSEDMMSLAERGVIHEQTSIRRSYEDDPAHFEETFKPMHHWAGDK
jgi:hypothetical protein